MDSYCLPTKTASWLVGVYKRWQKAGSWKRYCSKTKFAEKHISLFICDIDGVIVCVFDSSAVDRGFEACSGKTKDCIIGLCCFSAKHAALRSKIKDWLSRNQDNVSELSVISNRELLFQRVSTKISNSACWSITK